MSKYAEEEQMNQAMQAEQVEPDSCLTDNAMKELSDQLLEKFKDNEYMTNIIIRDNLDLKKKIMSLYGLARTLDYISEGAIDDPTIINMIELTRTMTSNYVEDILEALD